MKISIESLVACKITEKQKCRGEPLGISVFYLDWHTDRVFQGVWIVNNWSFCCKKKGGGVKVYLSCTISIRGL